MGPRWVMMRYNAAMQPALSRLAWVLSAGLLIGFGGCSCGSSTNTQPRRLRCAQGTTPCGNGCIPVSAVCCDDGTARTSSYCTNAGGGAAPGCFANDRDCAAAFPSGQRARYCCGKSGTFGSNDCPPGQRHCGLLCPGLTCAANERCGQAAGTVGVGQCVQR